MALSRTFLRGLGLTDEQVSAIVEGNEESIAALKEQRDRYKTQADKLKDAEAKIADLEAKAGEPDAWREKYEKVNSDFEAYKSDQKAKETMQHKKDAYTALLHEAGVSDKRIQSVLKVTDWDSIEIDAGGAIVDAEKHSESIKTDWSDFITSSSTEGAGTVQPPKNDGSVTKEQFNAMGYNERLKLYSENQELYNSLKGE